jgi:hypothetical protein
MAKEITDQQRYDRQELLIKSVRWLFWLIGFGSCIAFIPLFGESGNWMNIFWLLIPLAIVPLGIWFEKDKFNAGWD